MFVAALLAVRAAARNGLLRSQCCCCIDQWVARNIQVLLVVPWEEAAGKRGKERVEADPVEAKALLETAGRHQVMVQMTGNLMADSLTHCAIC